MTHTVWFFLSLLALLLAVMGGLGVYEDRHRQPCALCGDRGIGDDGQRCMLCSWRRG
ncbi:MAG TPA: hypothetical protein VM554_13035 [Acidisarcina sp.]|nr:hypothetical protein [Acidisarcina sp.]